MNPTTQPPQDSDTALNQLFSDMRKDAKKICELEQASAIKDSALLQGSIQIIDLQKENQRLNAMVSTMKHNERTMLSMIEGIFDRDPDLLTEQELREYIPVARFMEKHFSRPSYEVAIDLYLKTLKA